MIRTEKGADARHRRVNDEAPDRELSPQRAAELIDAGARLVDVRRPYEFEGGHLAGAENIEMNTLTAASESIERERPVIFYCRGGNRSAMAADAFRIAGYDAYSVAGGVTGWVESGMPLEPEDGEVRAPLPAS
jgi:rhodanese-related sulfurtransferase